MQVARSRHEWSVKHSHATVMYNYSFEEISGSMHARARTSQCAWSGRTLGSGPPRISHSAQHMLSTNDFFNRAVLDRAYRPRARRDSAFRDFDSSPSNATETIASQPEPPWASERSVRLFTGPLTPAEHYHQISHRLIGRAASVNCASICHNSRATSHISHNH